MMPYEKPKCMPANVSELTIQKIYKIHKFFTSTSYRAQRCCCCLLEFVFIFAHSMCCRLDTHLNDIWCEMHSHIPDWELTVLVGRLLHYSRNEVLKYAIATALAIVFKRFIKRRCEERKKMCVCAHYKKRRLPCRTTEEISSYVWWLSTLLFVTCFFIYFFCWFNQCTQVVWDSININCIRCIVGKKRVGTHLAIDWYKIHGDFFHSLLLLLLLLLLVIFCFIPFTKVARSFLTVITIAVHFFGLCFRTWHMIVLVIFLCRCFFFFRSLFRALHFVVYSPTLHAFKIGIVAHIIIITSVIWIIRLSLKSLQTTSKSKRRETTETNGINSRNTCCVYFMSESKCCWWWRFF